MHENTFLTPNNVTAIGTGLVAIGATAAYVANRAGEKNSATWRSVSTAVTALGESMDAFDGALFRYKKKLHDEGDGTVTIVESPNTDADNDRLQEGVMGVARIATAKNRGDSVGAALATAATILQPIPSTLRAAGEKRGRVFPENGKIPALDIWGTRAGRAAANVVATEFPGWPQKIADGLVVISTARTIYQRAKIVTAKDPENKLDVLPEKEKDKAGLRLKHMAGMAAIVIGAAVAANILMKNGQNKNGS